MTSPADGKADAAAAAATPAAFVEAEVPARRSKPWYTYFTPTAKIPGELGLLMVVMVPMLWKQFEPRTTKRVRHSVHRGHIARTMAKYVFAGVMVVYTWQAGMFPIEGNQTLQGTTYMGFGSGHI